MQTGRGQSNQARVSNNNNKWAGNLSNTPLTPTQHSLPGKGPNFAVTPKSHPNIDCISAIESISHKLTEHDVQELKSDVNSLLKRVPAPKADLTKEGRKALIELQRVPDRMVLTVGKGVALVVIDKEDYKQKEGNLLDQSSYRTIGRDPTNRIKAELIQISRRLRRKTGIDEGMYKAMHPIGCIPPSSMDYQQSIKLSFPSGL